MEALNISTLNTLDTITNLIFLMVALIPLYGIGLYHVIGDMPRLTLRFPALPTLHPVIKVKVNGHLKIITIRNPITNKWIASITLSNKIDNKPAIASTIGRFGNPYRFAMGAIAIMALIACGPTNPDTNEDGTKWGVIVADHPKACIESTPVLPDTIIKGLETWTLKVGNGTRNRCSYSVESDWVECKAKSPDTLYAIDRYCPATLKARAELGG